MFLPDKNLLLTLLKKIGGKADLRSMIAFHFLECAKASFVPAFEF
jgi:hypothetical protein